MADSKGNEPEKDLKKLEKQQELEDAAFLANLEKDSKEFDKVIHESGRELMCSNVLIAEYRTARSIAS